MIRVIYRFRIHPDAGEEFARLWREGTSYIQRLSPGACGSLLLEKRESSSERVAVARWQSYEAWLASREAGANVVPESLAEAIKATLAAPTTHEIFDELAEHPPAAGAASSRR